MCYVSRDVNPICYQISEVASGDSDSQQSGGTLRSRSIGDETKYRTLKEKRSYSTFILRCIYQ